MIITFLAGDAIGYCGKGEGVNSVWDNQAAAKKGVAEPLIS